MLHFGVIDAQSVMCVSCAGFDLGVVQAEPGPGGCGALAGVRRGEVLRDVISGMGPVFVKLGQVSRSLVSSGPLLRLICFEPSLETQARQPYSNWVLNGCCSHHNCSVSEMRD